MLRARGSRWLPGGGELRPHEKLGGPVSGGVGISLGLREAEGEIEEREREMRKSLAGFTKPAGTGPVTAVTGLTGPDRFRFRPVLNRPKFKF